MLKTIAAIIAVIAMALLLLSGCTNVTPTATPTPPPLTFTLKQIGTTKSHEGFQLLMGADDIYLLAVVSDGKVTQEFTLPPGGETFQVEPGVPVSVNQPLFSTASVGDYLKVTIVAYEDDDFGWVNTLIPVILPVLAPQLAVASLGGVSVLTTALESGAVEKGFSGDDDFVGSYEAVWTKGEGWGAGEYIAVGTQDLQLWFDIDVPGVTRRTTRPQATTVPVSPTPTAKLSPTRSPTPKATPTAARPLIAPTKTPTVSLSGQPVLTLQTVSARILDDHDPFGSGEVYAIAAIGIGQKVFWVSAPGRGANVQVNNGDLATLSASVEAFVGSDTAQIYIGVWEEDYDNCFFDLETKLGVVFQGNLGDFAALVHSSLDSCGDDLVGEGIQTLSAEENWLSGRHETALGDAVVIFEIEFSEGV